MKKIIFTVFALLPWLAAEAGGFQVVLQGVRQTSMGNTGTAVVDAASVFFNPGAMAFLPDNTIAAGGNFIFSNISYRAPEPFFDGAATDNPVSTPFYFYGVFGVGQDGAEGTGKKMKLGLGIFTPFGSTVNWGNEWVGRAAMEKLSLRSIFVQPTISYQITDKLGVGAGLDIVFGSVNLQRSAALPPTPGGFASVELDGRSNTGFGFNLGVYYKPIEQLSIGLNYRSRVDLSIEGGSANFSNFPAVAASSFPANTTFNSTLPLPAVATLGFGVQASEKLLLALDVRYTFWSAYEQLKFEFSNPVGGSTESISRRNYENSFTFCLGAEYSIDPALRLRAGAYYDMSPVPDGYMTAETPDANAIGLTIGLGAQLSKSLMLNAGFLYVNRAQRENIAATDANTISGTFKAVAFIPSIGLNYTF
jgi:long-chain fatty acid transport protein